MPFVGLVPGSSDGFVDHSQAFHTLNLISAGLSILGSCIVILAFVLFAQLRRFFARLIVYLAISDLWLCTSLIMGYSRPPHYMKCFVQSALGSFFGLASVLWTLAIADAVRRVLLARDLSLESRHEMRLHGVCWGSSLLAFLLVVCTGVAGPAGISCWIRNTATGAVVRMITFYVPLWLGIVYSGWVYWNVSSLMARLLEQHQVDGRLEYEASVWQYQQDIDRQRRSLRCLLLLPMVLVFCWTPSTVRRLLDMFYPGLAWWPLDYACVIAGPLQGALNAIIYGATPAVRDAMFGRLDHSAQKLRGIQHRLRSLRRGRSPRRSFQRLDEEDGLATGLRGAANASARHMASDPPPAAGDSAPTSSQSVVSPVAAAPEATVLGQPSTSLGHDRGRSGSGAVSDEERLSDSDRSSASSPCPQSVVESERSAPGGLPRVDPLPRARSCSSAREEASPPDGRTPVQSASVESGNGDDDGAGADAEGFPHEGGSDDHRPGELVE